MMSLQDSSQKIIRKEFKNERIPESIRIGNHFVDDFIFDENSHEKNYFNLNN